MIQPLKYDRNDPLQFVIDYLEKANEDDLASKVLDVFASRSFDVEQFNLLAKLYFDIRDIPKAEKYSLKVLSMVTENQARYNARANLAKMYNNINEPEKSLFYTKQNSLITPDDPDVKLETVFSNYLLGNKREAERILREMKANQNSLSERHRNIVDFNLGTYDMEAGRFLQGLGGFLINVKKLELWFSPKELPYKYWDGGLFPGRTLILFMEGGGIGDEFITVRWMQDLEKVGFKPIYYTTRKEIHDIFNRCGFKTVMTLDNVPKDSMWTYAMQSPLWLQVKPENVIRSKYLWASDQAKAKWAYLKEGSALKIGVRWQGNTKNERDLHRQVPLKQMMESLHKVFDGKDVEYYSLQIGDGEEQADDYPELIKLKDEIKTYDDTFAILENMDYVVTSCTSVLHASAIVGTKTMCMIPISAYFPWLSPPINNRDANTSIWYEDNVRVFKQIQYKNWDKPFSDLIEYLKKDLDENTNNRV